MLGKKSQHGTSWLHVSPETVLVAMEDDLGLLEELEVDDGITPELVEGFRQLAVDISTYAEKLAARVVGAELARLNALPEWLKLAVKKELCEAPTGSLKGDRPVSPVPSDSVRCEPPPARQSAAPKSTYASKVKQPSKPLARLPGDRVSTGAHENKSLSAQRLPRNDYRARRRIAHQSLRQDSYGLDPSHHVTNVFVDGHIVPPRGFHWKALRTMESTSGRKRGV